MTLNKLLFYFVAMGLFSVAQADEAEDAAEAERERQESFRFGMEYIVEDLDFGLFDAFIDAIDQRDMVERIFGLRLIDGGTGPIWPGRSSASSTSGCSTTERSKPISVTW